jgi:hypothetical protein
MPLTIDLVPSELHKYVGIRFEILDQHQRAEHMAFSFANECLAAGTTPFGRMSRNGVLLCDQTRAFLYGTDFGKITSPYRQGTHALLEKYIAQYVKPGMTDGQKVVVLSQSLLFDLPERYPKPPAFLYGESDQETLLKGGGHCSCKARLLCALCQMIGISARPVMMWTWREHAGKSTGKIMGGHSVVEALIDGRWGFLDPQHHLYCADESGRFYSVDEIRRQPEVFTKMPGSVTGPMHAAGYADQGGKDLFEFYWHKNFNPRCPTQITQHDVNEVYLGGWFWATDAVRSAQHMDAARHRAMLGEMADKGQISDEVYQMNLTQFRKAFNITDGQLPTRADTDFVGRPLK